MKKFQNWQKLFNAAIEPLILLDLNGNLITLNEKISNILDKNVDDLIGLNIYSLMSPNEFKFFEAQINNIVRLGKPVRIEKEIFGTILDLSINPIFDEQGKVEQIAFFSHDIIECKKREVDLEKKYSILNQIFNLTIPLCVIDKEFNLIRLNNNFSSILNVKKEEIIGRKCYDVIPGPLCNTPECTMRQILGGKDHCEYEKEFELIDGNKIVCNMRAVPYRKPDGEFIGIIKNYTNITAHKKAEDKLKESEKKYRQLIESAQEGIWVIDKDANTTFINPKMTEILGYSSDEMLGRHLFDFMAEEGIEIAKGNLERREQGIKEQYYSEFIRSDGTRIYTYLKTSPLMDGEGIYTGALAFVSDVTARKKAEISLRNSEEFLQNIFDGIQDGVSVLDKDLNIIRTNYWMEKLYNSDLPLIGKKCYVVYQKRTSPCPWCPSKLTLETGELHSAIGPYPSIENQIKWLEIVTVPFKNSEGVTVGVIEHIKDITERKKIEDMLKLNKERYSLATNAAKVGVWDWNIENGEFYLDPNVKMILGYSDEEIPNDRDAWETNAHSDDSKGVMESIQPFLEGKASEYVYEHRMLHKDGSIRWLQVRGRAIRDIQGNAIRMVGTYTDITAQKEAEVKLKISETKLKLLNKELEQKIELRTYELKFSEEKIRNLINNISDVLMEGDIDGTITFISPQIYDILGRQPKELIGIEYMELIHPEDKLDYKKLINTTLKAGSKFSMELRIMHKKGYYIPISIKGSIEEINNQLKFFVIIRDITEKRKIDEMMKSEIKKLTELDQIRSDLIRRISHELKTPLISIFSGSQYLLDHSIDNYKAHHIIELIHLGGHRLKILTDNLILAYNIDSKELNLNLKRKNIIQIIKNCIEDIVFQAKKRNIYINVELLKELYIEVDKSMIKRAISNILSNAVKNTPNNGNIIVSTFEHPNYIDIIVKDDGVGLTKKEELLLFKRFGKIERHGKGMGVDIEGAGLGLYIANEIVKLHHGEIIIKSKGRNKGSTFTIRLYSS